MLRVFSLEPEAAPTQPDTTMQEQFFDCSTPDLSEDAVNKIRHEASLQYETKVLEVVTEASGHIEAANNRAENAEWQAKQALEQVQHMRAFMQTEIGRQQNEVAKQQKEFAEQQAKSQEEARRIEELNSENRRLRAEAAQGRLLPIVFKDTSVGNAGQVQSSYAESTQPSTPTQKPKQYFFENAFGTLSRPVMTYSPTILAPPDVVATEFDKNFGFGQTQPVSYTHLTLPTILRV